MKLLLFLILTINVFCLSPRESASFVIQRGVNGQDAGIDAFGRLETAKPFTLGDYVFKYSAESSLFSTSVTNSADISYHTTKGMVQLKTTTDGDVAIFQSNLYHRYQAGKGGKAVFSLSAGTVATGSVKWGYYDENDGLFFKLEPDAFYVCQRSSAAGTETTPAVVDDCVESANFNGGEYSSKLAFQAFMSDTTKTTPFEIDFQWLGSGNSSFWLQGQNGRKELLHSFENSLDFDRPYMRTAVLPMRFESQGGAGNTTEQTMGIICCSIVSSGGEAPPETPFFAGMSATSTTDSAVESAVFAIQLKETFQGLDNRVVVFPREITAAVLTAGATFTISRNATIVTTWTDMPDNSAVQYSENVTSCTGGDTIDGIDLLTASTNQNIWFGADRSGFRKLFLSRNAFNTDSDNLCISVKRVSATDSTYKVGIGWGEVR